MFVVAGSDNGIYYDFTFYTAREVKFNRVFCESVPRLINHKPFYDTFYTTIKFQVELYKLGIYVIGDPKNYLGGTPQECLKNLIKLGQPSLR